MDTETTITIDLAKELTEEELASFKSQAKEAGAESLRDHFLSITIKKDAA